MANLWCKTQRTIRKGTKSWKSDVTTGGVSMCGLLGFRWYMNPTPTSHYSYMPSPAPQIYIHTCPPRPTPDLRFAYSAWCLPKVKGGTNHNSIKLQQRGTSVCRILIGWNSYCWETTVGQHGSDPLQRPQNYWWWWTATWEIQIQIQIQIQIHIQIQMQIQIQILFVKGRKLASTVQFFCKYILSVTNVIVMSLTNSLKAHLKTHGGEKSNKCMFWIKEHKGDKSYKCTKCDHATTSPPSLKAHWKIHSAERAAN